MYFIDKSSQTPIYKQLYQELQKDILQNYKPNQKLPSIRKLATIYNISKNSVAKAYSQLEIEGFIQSKPKSGYFVSKIDYKEFKSTTKTERPKLEEYKYDFFPAHLENATFPYKIWKRVYNKVINENTNFGFYPNGQGEFELREQIALYLNKHRATKADAQNIVITHGFIDSLNLIAKLTKPKLKHFATELPGYHIAHKCFSEFGFYISFINVKSDGIDLQQLKNSQANIVYITPSHQYPLGVTMPISNRLQLIEHINKIDGLILEDDYDSEMRYNTQPIPSLQGLNKERVAYLGTFAKALSPAIRVGFILLPNWLLKVYKNHYDSHFCHVSIDTQKTLAAFIKEGHLEQHIRRLRNLNRKKHNLMLECLKCLNHYEILAKDGGLSIIITPSKPFDWQKLKRLCKDQKLKIYLMQERSGSKQEALRVGFGGLNLNDIPKAIEAIGRVWNECFI